MNIVFVGIFVGTMTVTSYRSIPTQTDDSPFYTSIGEHVNVHGVAVSRDLLDRWGGPIHYGDVIFIEDVGYKVVNDTMHERWTNRVDVWVETLDKEHRFYSKFKNKQLKVWIVKKD